MGTTKSTHFFKDKPVFGFDIGHSSLKVMQIEHHGKMPRIVGFGDISFEPGAIDDGVIVDHKVIAKAAKELFKSHLKGEITTNRVVIAIPSYRTFSRLINLPAISGKQLYDAVALEAEQYIPVPLEELYLDYEIVGQGEEGTLDVFTVAVPRKIVDSQIKLMELLGLETVGVKTTIDAAGTLYKQDKQSDIPTVLIDFGSMSADIGIFDQHMLVSGTVSGGGLVFTNRIRDKLGVSDAEAHLIKTKYGLGPSKKQGEIQDALEPVLQQIAQEIRRMIRYYEDRYGNKKVTQVVTLGGGANITGLADFLTNNLRIAVRSCDPWTYCDHKGFEMPDKADKTMYATVMGLSLIQPKELF